MPIVPWMWTLVDFLSWSFARLRARVEVSIEGEVPPGPTLLCAKHSSALDIPILAHLCWKLRRDRPYFQMGSFIGYPVLGSMGPLLRRLGGFPVMRPKEVRRLARRRGWDRSRALRRMKAVNEEAEQIRQEVLREGGTLVVFPEGTRDDARVRPLVSELEVESALELHRLGFKVAIWPAVLSYGRPSRWRRRVRLDFAPPFHTSGEEAHEILSRIEQVFTERWLPPERISGGAATPSEAMNAQESR